MLLRGIYTFEPRPEDHNHTLPFTCNDTLIFLEVLKRDSNWIQVVDIYGRVGYVPKIFVEPYEDYGNRDVILTFLVDAIVKARQNDLHSASSLELLRDEIRHNPAAVTSRSLKMLRVFQGRSGSETEEKTRRSKSDHHLTKHSSHRRLSTLEIMGGTHLRTGSSEGSESEVNQYERDQNIRRRRSSTSQFNAHRKNRHSDTSVRTALEDSESHHLKDNKRDGRRSKELSHSPSSSLLKMKSSLINVIQETSGLNSRVSESVLNEVFQRIKGNPALAENLSTSVLLSEEKQDGPIYELSQILKSLSNLSKEGIKQSGRRKKPPLPAQADLDKLRKLLIECDPLEATRKLESGHHAFSQDLVHLYHLESPTLIKERILDIFLIICSLDKKGRARLLSSKLPIYLARELMAVNSECKIFEQVVDLLTMLLSCGETMPDTHFQILSSGFTNYLLRDVEDSFAKSCENEYDKISAPFSSLIKLILAYNLQFSQNAKENIVLKVIAERWKRPRGFITIMIELFKKASDPLQLERENDFNRPLPHSVFKMVADMCLCQKTASQFSAEDISVLTNCIIDGLCDNPAGSIRMGYLYVLRALLGNIQQSLKDIRTVLLSILLENDPLAIPEQQTIRQISREHPALFLRSISRIKTNVDTDIDYNAEENENDSYLSS